MRMLAAVAAPVETRQQAQPVMPKGRRSRAARKVSSIAAPDSAAGAGASQSRYRLILQRPKPFKLSWFTMQCIMGSYFTQHLVLQMALREIVDVVSHCCCISGTRAPPWAPPWARNLLLTYSCVSIHRCSRTQQLWSRGAAPLSPLEISFTAAAHHYITTATARRIQWPLYRVSCQQHSATFDKSINKLD